MRVCTYVYMLIQSCKCPWVCVEQKENTYDARTPRTYVRWTSCRGQNHEFWPMKYVTDVDMCNAIKKMFTLSGS